MSVAGVALIVFLIGILALIIVPDLKDPGSEVAEEEAAVRRS